MIGGLTDVLALQEVVVFTKVVGEYPRKALVNNFLSLCVGTATLGLNPLVFKLRLPDGAVSVALIMCSSSIVL